MAKTINLGLDDNGKMIKAIVDDEDYEWLNEFTWCRHSNNYAYRSLTKKEMGLDYKRSNRKHVFMHHLIMGVPLYKKVIDHINRNSLDNRRANLRIISMRANNMNVRGHRRNISISRRGFSFHITGPKDKLELIRDYAYEVLGVNDKDN